MINPAWIGCTFKAWQCGQSVDCLNLTSPAGIGVWVVINSKNLPHIMTLLDTGYIVRPVKQVKE